MTKAMSKLMKKLSSLFLLVVFTSAQVSPLFAEQIELTDNELDQIHAGGLNLNFDSFYGNIGSTATSQGPTNLSTTSGTNPVASNLGGNKNVTILSPFQIKSPAQPSAPKPSETVSAVTLPAEPKSPLQIVEAKPSSLPSNPESLINTTTTNTPATPATSSQTSLPKGTKIFEIQTSSAPDQFSIETRSESLIQFETRELSQVESFPVTASEVPSSDPLVAVDTTYLMAASSALTNSAITTDSVIATESSIPTQSIADNNTTSLPPITNSTAARETQNTTLSGTSNPPPLASSNTPPPDSDSSDFIPPEGTKTFDVIAGNSGNGNFEVTVGSNTDLSSALSAAGNAHNSINIADSSQAGLRALVNVSASGATVPVLLNLTVIMGDNYGNIVNSNELNLSNFTTFQVP